MTLPFNPAHIRFTAEAILHGEGQGFVPCTVEMTTADYEVTEIRVTKNTEKHEESTDELSTIRERVGRIARRLEDVASELRMVAEGLSPEESAQTLEKIEKKLGIR